MSAAVSTRACPACEAELSLVYHCEACGELLRDPAGGVSAFARFGFEAVYPLDPERLEARYLELSRAFHPDRQLKKSPKQQSYALRHSAALNEAYNVLRDPRRRADALLLAHGGKTADQDKRTPQAFLIEQMELRESVEDAQARGDEATLAQARERAASERGACEARVAELFADPAFPSPELLERVRAQLNVWKYWITLGKELA